MTVLTPPVFRPLRRAGFAALHWFAAAGVALSALFAPAAHAAEYSDRFSALSSRGPAGSGNNVLIAGFVVNDGVPKKIVVRAAGPALGAYGVPGTIVNPKLELYNLSGSLLASNDDWESSEGPALTNAFGQLGAFPFATGSRDAAMIATLGAGAYTAHVTGADGGSGIALVEVYDMTGTPRLVSLSTRAEVGTGGATLITGLVISQTSGTRRVLLRAIGPTLRDFGVSTGISDPAIAIYNSGAVQIASNDNWGSGTDVAAVSTAFAQAGAFPLASGTKDAAVVIDLPPGAYSVHAAGVGGATGVALMEAYDLTPEVIPILSIAATVPSTTTASGAPPAAITVTRTGNTSVPLVVDYTVGGTAAPGTEYTALPGSVTIPAGQSSATLLVDAFAGAGAGSTNKTVSVTLKSAERYTIPTQSSATTTIFYESGVLYLSQLRAPAGSSSTAYGTATIQVSPDGSFAFVNVAFSNLSSPEVVAYLRLGNEGQEGDPILRLPNGQVTGVLWDFAATGSYSSADLIDALRNGRIFVSIDTTNFPAGEARGGFLRATGSTTFVAPSAPPSFSLANPNDAEAARFLLQATFGPRPADIEAVKSRGYAGWIDDQMAATQSMHRTMIMADFALNNSGGQGGTSTTPNTRPGTQHRANTWWTVALSGQDQLRQRVAFALSELFVVSDANGTLYDRQEALCHYYDMLGRNAFGNFRTLLEEVTLSPVMGVYLSSLRNARATSPTSAQPDENYAREIMQLFSIGLNQLQPDGTLKLDATGLPVATYSQTTITEMAKVFTGWAFASANTANSQFRGAPSDYISPMQMWQFYHDVSAKNIVNGVSLAANRTGQQDLASALDALFNHPNTAPFISRRLIQRLVTSNPSPGYVYRVAQKFENDGSGVRGNLGAVVRAILLDYEARSPAVMANPTFGKLKEPLLRLTAMLRAMNATSTTGRYLITNPEGSLAQAPMRSPTVFNFFEPDFVLPGTLAAAGLYAPEYQIFTDTTAISVPNYLYSYVYTNPSNISLDLTALTPYARNNPELLGRLNLWFAAGGMSTAVQNRITTALNAVPTSTTDIDRVRLALYLTVVTQDAAVQK